MPFTEKLKRITYNNKYMHVFIFLFSIVYFVPIHLNFITMKRKLTRFSAKNSHCRNPLRSYVLQVVPSNMTENVERKCRNKLYF